MTQTLSPNWFIAATTTTQVASNGRGGASAIGNDPAAGPAFGDIHRGGHFEWDIKSLLNTGGAGTLDTITFSGLMLNGGNVILNGATFALTVADTADGIQQDVGRTIRSPGPGNVDLIENATAANSGALGPLTPQTLTTSNNRFFGLDLNLHTEVVMVGGTGVTAGDTFGIMEKIDNNTILVAGQAATPAAADVDFRIVGLEQHIGGVACSVGGSGAVSGIVTFQGLPNYN
jgi:hypothetical protein